MTSTLKSCVSRNSSSVGSKPSSFEIQDKWSAFA
jgi:hypothetical protein